MTGLRRGAVLALLLLAPGTGVQGQLPDTTVYQAAATSEHPRGTVVSVMVRIPAGSRDDPQGMEGAAWMLGELMAHQAGELVGPDASVAVEVSRSESRYTLLAVPGSWQEAWRRLEDVLFAAPLTDNDVESHRQELLGALGFDAGSPVRNFELESARLVAPTSDPWARPVLGTVETVQQITTSALSDFKASHYRAARVSVAVVGPRGSIPGGPGATAASRAPAPAPAAEVVALPAWQLEDRVTLVQDITNSWVAVAWPVSPDAPRTSLEFLAHLLEEDLDPDPPDPDRFSVAVRLVDAPGGVVLVVEAAVFPEAADRWEARILRSKERFVRSPMDEDFLGWRRRRFRTVRLLAESAPEAEAARLAADLARDGVVRDLSLEIWGLNGAGLLDAAQSLGPPRILRLGPDLAPDGSRN